MCVCVEGGTGGGWGACLCGVCVVCVRVVRVCLFVFVYGVARVYMRIAC